MAPKGGSHRGPSIERTTEYDEFMDDLAAYHSARGFVPFHDMPVIAALIFLFL